MALRTQVSGLCLAGGHRGASAADGRPVLPQGCLPDAVPLPPDSRRGVEPGREGAGVFQPRAQPEPAAGRAQDPERGLPPAPVHPVRASWHREDGDHHRGCLTGDDGRPLCSASAAGSGCRIRELEGLGRRGLCRVCSWGSWDSSPQPVRHPPLQRRCVLPTSPLSAQPGAPRADAGWGGAAGGSPWACGPPRRAWRVAWHPGSKSTCPLVSPSPEGAPHAAGQQGPGLRTLQQCGRPRVPAAA